MTLLAGAAVGGGCSGVGLRADHPGAPGEQVQAYLGSTALCFSASRSNMINRLQIEKEAPGFPALAQMRIRL